LHCFSLIYFAGEPLCFALLCCALHCFALLCVALQGNRYALPCCALLFFEGRVTGEPPGLGSIARYLKIPSKNPLRLALLCKGTAMLCLAVLFFSLRGESRGNRPGYVASPDTLRYNVRTL
jgi:hypothetical protein